MLQLSTPLTADLLGLFGSALLVVGYHLYLAARLRRDPNYTIQAVNRSARTAWVEALMAGNQRDVLPVQTLRNSTMAATFLASTAILLVIGVLNLSDHGGTLGHAIESIAHKEAGGELWAFQLMPLVVDLFCAFFCFTLAIRMYNHVGYLINANMPGHTVVTPQYVAELLNRGGWYYSLGMRSYYLAVPLLLGLFGPSYMLLATLGLMVIFYHVDRSPIQDLLPRPSGSQEEPAAPPPLELRPVPGGSQRNRRGAGREPEVLQERQGAVG